MRPSFPALIAIALAIGPFASDSIAQSWPASIRPFLRDHCIDCHQGDQSEAGLDLSKLDDELNQAETIRRWILVHDRLSAGEMPPPETAPIEPSRRSAIVDQLAEALTAADRQRSDVVLRRLNRNEYENTINDLFGTDCMVKELLPVDNSTAGFDNVGEGLAMSAEATAAYLRAADAVLDCVFGPAQAPKRIDHVTNLLDQKTHDGKQALASQIGRMFRQTEAGLVIFQSGYCPTNLVNFSRLRAPAGTYRGTIRCRAIQSDQPVTLRIFGGDTIVGRREKHLVGYFDVPPGEWTTIEFSDRLVESGGTFQPKCYGTRDTRKNADSYPEPGIEIGEITIEGPLEPWPPTSRKQLLAEVEIESATIDDARSILKQLIPRAFRRRVSEDEVEPFVGLVASALAQERSFEDALRLGIKGVLCSPEFLFLDEPGTESISQTALASRLSYFLWSSMPDAELMRLADQGRLTQPDVLREQVERMLQDPRSDAFVVNFLGQWLDLREIDFTSPDQNLYPEFDELLKISMIEETHRFFRELLDHDLSVMNVIDSDFTFLNERLARHYGFEGVRGQTFRKFDLPPESVRGGVLTQASVLKVTANGTNTSPVLRGVWVMDNLLGKTVPPPPDGVAAVEPDIRGATTLRQQLAKHRDDASCATCHDRIDPAGFALENFDVIGGWRDRYRTVGEGDRPGFSQHPITFAWVRYRLGLPVDATGRLPDGQSFTEIRELKQILLQDPQSIRRGLTEKLLIYGLGRQLGFSDRPEIDNLVDELDDQNDGLRSLIHELVQSESFRRP